MNRAQKMAWFNIAVVTVSLTITAIALAILFTKFGWPKGLAGFGGLGLCGIMGFSGLIFRKDRGNVIFDERDNTIHRRALLAGYASSYGFFVIACLLPLFIYGPHGAISVGYPCMLPIGGMITFELVRSVTLLGQYGWRERNHE